jgi:hypothetical protein
MQLAEQVLSASHGPPRPNSLAQYCRASKPSHGARALALTSFRPVDLVASEMAVIAFPGGRGAPGNRAGRDGRAAEAELAVAENVGDMRG